MWEGFSSVRGVENALCSQSLSKTPTSLRPCAASTQHTCASFAKGASLCATTWILETWYVAGRCQTQAKRRDVEGTWREKQTFCLLVYLWTHEWSFGIQIERRSVEFQSVIVSQTWRLVALLSLRQTVFEQGFPEVRLVDRSLLRYSSPIVDFFPHPTKYRARYQDQEAVQTMCSCCKSFTISPRKTK